MQPLGWLSEMDEIQGDAVNPQVTDQDPVMIHFRSTVVQEPDKPNRKENSKKKKTENRKANVK